jgi:hypothetical protein
MRKMIRNLDMSFFKGMLEPILRAIKVSSLTLQVAGRSKHQTTIFSQSSKPDLLTSLFEKHGSDKSSSMESGVHSYARFYSLLLGVNRESIGTVFECGIGTNNLNLPSNMGRTGIPGASLRAWRDYFPNAEIYGADIDSEILFEEERIKTFYVDQLSGSDISKMWSKMPNLEFDLIIDDGLHTFEAGVTFYENSIARLKNSGIYVIEDVTPQNLVKFVDYFKKSDNFVDFVILKSLKRGLRPDNNLILIRKL